MASRNDTPTQLGSSLPTARRSVSKVGTVGRGDRRLYPSPDPFQSRLYQSFRDLGNSLQSGLVFGTSEEMARGIPAV